MVCLTEQANHNEAVVMMQGLCTMPSTLLVVVYTPKICLAPATTHHYYVMSVYSFSCCLVVCQFALSYGECICPAGTKLPRSSVCLMPWVCIHFPTTVLCSGCLVSWVCTHDCHKYLWHTPQWKCTPCAVPLSSAGIGLGCFGAIWTITCHESSWQHRSRGKDMHIYWIPPMVATHRGYGRVATCMTA